MYTHTLTLDDVDGWDRVWGVRQTGREVRLDRVLSAEEGFPPGGGAEEGAGVTFDLQRVERDLHTPAEEDEDIAVGRVRVRELVDVLEGGGRG